MPALPSVRRHRRAQFNVSTSVPSRVKLWIYRALMQCGGYREFIQSHGFEDERLAKVIGLEHWINADDFDDKAIRVELKKLALVAEKTAASTSLPASLQQNIHKLACMVGLTDTDCRVLEFAVMVFNNDFLTTATDSLGNVSSNDLMRALSVLLDIPEPDIRLSLGERGLLVRSGLVSIDRNGMNYISRKLDLLSNSFADCLLTLDAEPVSLLRETVTPASAPELAWSDYAHIEQEMLILRSYLEAVSTEAKTGVNILLHGDPGTGKSQLARVVAQHLQRQLYEVAFCDEDGDSVGGENRLRAYRAGQCFFANSRAMLVFDEAEDVLTGENDIFRPRRAQSRKAWLNRMLEENAVPTLWLSNSTYGIDPAVIRRFDMVIELPIPSRKHRSRMLTEFFGDMLSKEEIAEFSQLTDLSPAVARSAIAVACSVKAQLPDSKSADVVKSLVNSTLKAQGFRTLEKTKTVPPLPAVYDPAFVNCESDLVSLAQGIGKASSARLCLYGPPGTGKTAYAHWLAKQLDLPLIMKKSSDLLGMYVGQTEKNIARAFEQAREEPSVLLIDEVDSLLQDRRSLRAGWEVTMVNELLTQLEAFEGIFIASTNLADNLDQAALRRFDLKLRFDYLAPEQAVQLTHRCCESLGLPAPDESVTRTLGSLGNLTPGDFATASRRHKFSPIGSAQEFVSVLQGECAAKEDARRPMGFLH